MFFWELFYWCTESPTTKCENILISLLPGASGISGEVVKIVSRKNASCSLSILLISSRIFHDWSLRPVIGKNAQLHKFSCFLALITLHCELVLVAPINYRKTLLHTARPGRWVVAVFRNDIAFIALALGKVSRDRLVERNLWFSRVVARVRIECHPTAPQDRKQNQL